jgi:5-methylcytosine-specific restriction endonuclease McrA
VYDTAEWRTVRLEVLARDRNQCMVRISRKCTVIAGAVDHRVPVSEGGAPFDKANLRSVCVPCNTALRNRRRAALARRQLGEPNPAPSGRRGPARRAQGATGLAW